VTVQFELVDRRGVTRPIEARAGDTVAQTLLRSFIPPLTVYVESGGQPWADTRRLVDGGRYVAHLIEGYDLDSIRSLYLREATEDGADEDGAAYVKRRLVFTDDGRLRLEQTSLTLEETARLVEQTIASTIRRFRLVGPGDSLVIALSGGVDSGSLMLALGALLESGELPFEVIAATFQDFDSRHTEALKRAQGLAARFGVRHELVPDDVARAVFHLNRPLRQVLPALMETEDAHQTMYVDHHTTRRTLEVFAAEQGTDQIALGLHTSDLLAGQLNAQASGYRYGQLPLRQVGDFRYVFPLAFVPKKELDLYYLHAMGSIPAQSPPNPWEFNPLDRNFYYYIADFLQSMWPGVEHWLLTSPPLSPDDKTEYVGCGNCGGALDPQGRPWTPGDFCDVCSLLARYGYVQGV
jgi:tRNA(Ile)-lysidine synthase TilS/MesJ